MSCVCNPPPLPIPYIVTAMSRRRLQAVVNILGVWETQVREENPHLETAHNLTSAQRVRRLRAQAAVQALVDPASTQLRTREADAGAGDAAGEMRFGDGNVKGSGDVSDAAGAIIALMRDWWPRLILAAVEAREWDFICRCVYWYAL